MAERRFETKKHIPNNADVNLPEITASLEMLTVDASLPPPSESKRILRKRLPRPVSTEILNRRCSLKPKKRKHAELESDDEIKEYYLDKNLKRKPNTLETIFEENDGATENSKYMSAKKFKRMIQFQDAPTYSKLKERRARIKKIFGSKIINRRFETMQSLLNKLSDIQLDSPVSIDIERK